MKRTNKKAFSLAEVLITTVLMFTVIALVTPALKNNFDNDKPKLRFTYSQILKIATELLANPQIYPDGSGFFNTTIYKDPTTGEEFSGNYKFTNLFRSKLNILEEINNDKLKNIQGSPLSCTNDSCTYCTSNCQEASCFKTNNKITYCIAKNSHNKGFEDKDNGYIVIQVYLTDEINKKKGYYVKLSTTGDVSVLSPGKIKDDSGNALDCQKASTYKTYNQCRMDNMLLYTNINKEFNNEKDN